MWTVTKDNTLKLIAADPRVREGSVGKALMFAIAVMLKRGLPATRILKMCELTIDLWKAKVLE